MGNSERMVQQGDKMTEISSANFMKLTINQVSDMLLNDLNDSDREQVGALLVGSDQDGKRYKLSVVLEYE